MGIGLSVERFRGEFAAIIHGDHLGVSTAFGNALHRGATASYELIQKSHIHQKADLVLLSLIV